jgi:death-on-curing family protein
MKYVSKRMIVVINRMVLELSGGAQPLGSNIRPGQNLGFVDTIYANVLFGKPVYPDIYYQAGAYMFYIIKDHVFLDGNKRTGLATAVTFLEWNEILFAHFHLSDVFDFVMSVAAGENTPGTVIPQIATWFRELSLPSSV